ncbi:MAG: hypothetical protein PHQ43_12125 [Dehalococcoidales bacterium]|nr:hypothetical protein [Dehalococcoidales bacterium]
MDRVNDIDTLKTCLYGAIETLNFYADGRSYHGILFVPDTPAGDFMSDFSEDAELGLLKPGMRARKTLDQIKGLLKGY